jgi:hypothetical protein
MKNFLITLVTLISLNQALACSETNLFVSDPKMLAMEIVNQGDAGTCYAHTISDLYNYENATSKSDSLHTFWTAYIHKKRFLHWQPRELDYSLLAWAYYDVQKNGICSYDLVENQIKQLKQGVPYNNDQVMYLIHAFFVRKALRKQSDSKVYQEVIVKTFQDLTKEPTLFEVPWTLPDLEKILGSMKSKAMKKSFYDFLEQDVFNVCNFDDRLEANAHLIGKGFAFASNKKVQRNIESLLDKNKAVAVGYCASKVYDNDPEKTNNLNMFPRIARSFVGACGAHYSMLVGSRKNGNSCDFLLRNSYGTGFWAYPTMECWCLDKTTNEQKNCKKADVTSTMKVLGCWVKAEKMSANSFDHYSFE